ncbi:MAG: sulfite exporter TauE/SafE family protein [Phycisphaerales bacterium]
MFEYAGWILFGISVGIIGTLIGVGGGFLMIPVLLFCCKDKTPAVITAISLAVICVNSSSGSIAYARMKRINYRAGLLFAAAAVPGAIAGAYLIQYIPQRVFNIIFGTILLLMGIYLFVSARKMLKPEHEAKTFPKYNIPAGMAISTFTGLISSLLGIGGGIIHVPMMVYLLKFPVHFATATSHFTLAIMTFFGTLVHIYNGDLAGQWKIILLLSAGVIGGAQVGAALSQKIHGSIIIKILSVVLALVGFRIIWQGF